MALLHQILIIAMPLAPETLYALLALTSCATLILAIACIRLWQSKQTLIASQEAERGLDPLTNVWNRLRFMELAERELNHVQRTGRCAAAMIVDLDHGKRINEEYGHIGGDLAVQFLARCAQHSIRDYDLLARYSGEELAMLLPDTTQEGAEAVACRLRNAIAAENVVLPNGKNFLITVTIGIAALSRETDTLDDLLLAADSALLEAKAQGHNRTVAQKV